MVSGCAKTRANASRICDFAWMADWDDLRAVLAVARGGTLAAAAAELGVNYTTVARRVARAEAALGEGLFEKLADGYRATEAGLRVAAHVGDMEEAEHALLRELRGRDGTLEGPLTITAPQLLLAHFLSPVLGAFCADYPEVALQINASNDLLDLNRRQADLAIRISRNPGDTLKGLRLAEQENAGFGREDVVAGMVADPDAPVDWLVYDAYPDLPKGVAAAYPGARVSMRFDDMGAMVGAAQAGLGVVRMPMFLGRRAGLVQVPGLVPQPYAEIWVVGHPDVWPSAKLVAFRERLVPYFRAHRGLFVG